MSRGSDDVLLRVMAHRASQILMAPAVDMAAAHSTLDTPTFRLPALGNEVSWLTRTRTLVWRRRGSSRRSLSRRNGHILGGIVSSPARCGASQRVWGGLLLKMGGLLNCILMHPDVSFMYPACIPGSGRNTTEYIRIQIRIQPDICIHTLTLHPLADTYPPREYICRIHWDTTGYDGGSCCIL